MLPAVVLAGGEGQRLRPLTTVTPKPLLPLLGRPLVAYALDALRRNGVERAVLACGYRADALRQTLGNAYDGMQLAYSVEAEPLGTGGAVRLAAEGFESTFLAANGDCLWWSGLADALALHRARGAVATILLASVDDASAYGSVETDGGRVTSFREKAPGGAARGGTVNAGIYLLEPAVREAIRAGKPTSIEHEVFPALAAQGALWAAPLEGGFVDVGTCEAYLRTHWTLLDRLPDAGAAADSSARIDEGAEIVAPAFLGRGAVVETGARVGPHAAVYDGAHVAERAVVEASVVGRRAGIGAGSRVSASIVGDGARLGPACELSALAIASPGAVLPAGTVLAGGGEEPADAATEHPAKARS